MEYDFIFLDSLENQHLERLKFQKFSRASVPNLQRWFTGPPDPSTVLCKIRGLYLHLTLPLFSFYKCFLKPRNNNFLLCKAFTLHCSAVVFPNWLFGAHSLLGKKPLPNLLAGNCGAFTTTIINITAKVKYYYQ